MYLYMLKGTGFAKRDDDWRCKAPCLKWHRRKTSFCRFCKARPPKRRLTRAELEEHKASHRLKLDRWKEPKVESNL